MVGAGHELVNTSGTLSQTNESSVITGEGAPKNALYNVPAKLKHYSQKKRTVMTSIEHQVLGRTVVIFWTRCTTSISRSAGGG